MDGWHDPAGSPGSFYFGGWRRLGEDDFHFGYAELEAFVRPTSVDVQKAVRCMGLEFRSEIRQR